MLAFVKSKYATWTAHHKRPLKRKRVPTFFSSQFVRNVRGEIITVLHTWQNIIFRIQAPYTNTKLKYTHYNIANKHKRGNARNYENVDVEEIVSARIIYKYTYRYAYYTYLYANILYT